MWLDGYGGAVAKAFGSFGDAIHTMADKYDSADQATEHAAKNAGKDA